MKGARAIAGEGSCCWRAGGAGVSTGEVVGRMLETAGRTGEDEAAFVSDEDGRRGRAGGDAAAGCGSADCRISCRSDGVECSSWRADCEPCGKFNLTGDCC